MNIFFTGASSFTGSAFVRSLLDAGHEVTCTFTRKSPSDYTDLSLERLNLIRDDVRAVWSAAFGSDAMIQALKEKPCDLLCIHGAYVGDQRAAQYPLMESVASNTHRIQEVLKAASDSGVRSVVHTGSYYEADTGAGGMPLSTFSQYSLSKTLSWQIVRYWANSLRLPLMKFVVANPFGMLEKPSFTSFLAKSWIQKAPLPVVKTPDYLRDNVPVSLMAECYRVLCEHQFRSPLAEVVYEPGCYVESQGAFGLRFARELSSRLGLPCPLECARQTDFSEPMTRFNRQKAQELLKLDPTCRASWDEKGFWDTAANWYGKHFSPKTL